MNEKTFRTAYELFQSLQAAPSDADIIMQLTQALEFAHYRGYSEGAEDQEDIAREDAVDLDGDVRSIPLWGSVCDFLSDKGYAAPEADADEFMLDYWLPFVRG